MIASAVALSLSVGACGDSRASGRGAGPAALELGSFSVLRGPAEPAERPPALALEAVSRSNAAHAMGGTFVPPASARSLALGASAAWALAARGAVCLLHEVQLPQGPGPGYGFTCLPTSEARAGRLLTTVTPVAHHPGMTLVEGIVPDGARDVALALRARGRAVPSVGRNAYVGLAHDPVAVTFRLGGVTLRVPVPAAPAGPRGG
jgi:hypothetical protein